MTSTLRSSRTGLTALLLIGLLAVVGCTAGAAARESNQTSASVPSTGEGPSAGGGGGSEPGGGGGACESCDPIDPDGPVTGAPGVTEPEPGDGALHVEPEPGIVNPTPHTFDHVKVSADGRTLTIYYWGGVEDCYGLASVDVTQGPDGSLVITILEGSRAAAAGQACIDIALLKAVTVTLDQAVFIPGAVDVAE